MEFITEYINNESALLNIISLGIGALGIALAGYFYIKSKPFKLIASASRSFRIISDRSQKVPGLEVSIHGKPASVVTVTRLAIWNTGNRTVDSSDIPSIDPLIIHSTKGAHIFDIEVTEQTKNANQVSVVKSDASNNYQIHFEYLDPGDGALLNIVHNGKDVDEFTLKGSVKGGKIGKTGGADEAISAPASMVGPPIQLSMSGREYFGLMGYLFLAASPIAAVAYFILKEKELLFTSGFALILGFAARALVKRFYPPSRIRAFDDDL